MFKPCETTVVRFSSVFAGTNVKFVSEDLKKCQITHRIVPRNCSSQLFGFGYYSVTPNRHRIEKNLRLNVPVAEIVTPLLS